MFLINYKSAKAKQTTTKIKKARKYYSRPKMLTMMKSTTMIMAVCYMYATTAVFVSAKESSLRGGRRDMQVVVDEDACSVNVQLNS